MFKFEIYKNGVKYGNANIDSIELAKELICALDDKGFSVKITP